MPLDENGMLLLLTAFVLVTPTPPNPMVVTDLHALGIEPRRELLVVEEIESRLEVSRAAVPLHVPTVLLREGRFELRLEPHRDVEDGPAQELTPGHAASKKTASPGLFGHERMISDSVRSMDGTRGRRALKSAPTMSASSPG